MTESWTGASPKTYWRDRRLVPRGSEERVPDANIAERLRDLAARRPDQAAVREPIGREGRGDVGGAGGSQVRYATWTFRELDAEVDRLCHALVRIGLERGMRTVLMVRPGRDFFAIAFALFRIGAVPVLIDPGLGLRPIRRALAEATPEAFIGVRKAHLARLVLGWGRPTVRIAVATDGRIPRFAPSLASLRLYAEPNVPYSPPRTRADETAAILFTSGSTGAPKGAVYHHGILTAQADLLRDLYGIAEGEVDLPTFPLFALFDVALGMTAVIPEMDFTRPGDADPAKLIEAIERFAVRNLFASPALLRTLARHGEATGRRLPSLERVLSAGAPVPAAEIERLVAMLRAGVQVHTPYGATEALPVASIGSDELLPTAEQTRAGAGVCVGRPAPGIEVAIVPVMREPIARLTSELRLPPGRVGEICVRGRIVSRSYFGRPDANRFAKIIDGHRLWHRMGDLGGFDPEGRLWFLGRKADRVETAEGPLDTAAVEGVFDAHPAVRRSALVGIGPRGEQRAVVCVELEPGTGGKGTVVAELRDLAKRLPLTRGIDTFLIHPRFPVDIRHNAKIRREELALWAGEKIGGPR